MGKLVTFFYWFLFTYARLRILVSTRWRPYHYLSVDMNHVKEKQT